MNMVLVLMAKAFKLNYSTPTNNNQRISSNPHNRQIAQPGMNMGQDRQMQILRGNGRNQFRRYVGQNVGNQNGYNANPNRNGNVVAARDEGNSMGNNGNQIRCYNCRGLGHLARNCTVRPMRRDAAYLQTQLLIAQKEEAGIQLQAEEFDLMAVAADLDEIEEVNTNCILVANLQRALTTVTVTGKAPGYDSGRISLEEQYTELLEPIPEPHQVQQNNSNVISEVSSVEQDGGTVDQHPATVEETRALYDSLYNNLSMEVKKINLVNRKMKEINADLTTELARYKNQEKCFEISQEKYDKLERCYQKSVYQEQCLTKKINALHLSSGKQITTLNEEISNLNNQLSKEKSTVSSLLEEKKKLKSDFKIREDELLDKQIQLENKIKELDNILVKTGQSIQMMHMLSPKLQNFEIQFLKEEAKFVRDFESLAKEADESLAKYKALELEIERLLRVVIKWLQAQLEDLKGKSEDTPCVSDTLDPLSQKLENENVELEYQALNYAKENAYLKTTYKNLFDSISVTRTQTKTIIDSLQNKLHDTIYENAKLRAQLFDKVSEQKDITNSTSVPQKVYEMNDLSNPVTLNSVPTPQESKVMKNDNVIAPGMFRINPSKTSREDKFVPINKVRARVKTNPITVSQSHVITKKDVNSDTNGFSSTRVNITAKTRRPQPRSNKMNDRVPSESMSSSTKNKEVKVEEHHRNLLLSKNKKHMSSECNNVKLAIRNDKSEVVCAMCKQCLITANHDVCVLNYVNDMNSRGKKQKANVSNTENQKKQKPKVMKPKKVGSNERLASPKPSKPRSCLRWSPTGRIFDLKGKIIATSESECQSDCSNGDNACTSNPQEPTIKRFPNSTSFLGRLSKFFLGTVRFGNDHIAAILGFGDLQWGNILITRVYFVEGLGHNLFSVGQFCDSDLEVAFRRNTCFVRNLEGVDLLKGNRTTNLYTINLHYIVSASPICLMARATSTKSWKKQKGISLISQSHVITKKDVNSDSKGFSSIGVNITAKTRRPQPRSNIKNDRVPSESMSSCIKNKEVEVEEHHRNLLLSKNKKHMSSECNNVKLAIRNDKSDVVCAMCKQCLITANHDVCALNYVNGMNSRGKKQKVNVLNTKNQKKQKPKFKKPKKVGSQERLASHKPSKPKICLRWSPTGRIFDIKGKIIATSKSECQSDCSNGDNACTSNPQEPTIKRFPNSTSFLGRQFCDSDLEVAFRRNTCFVKNLEGVYLLKGNCTTNLYTINLHDMTSASPICLMGRAISIKLWLWHQCLSHLIFNTINNLAINDLVTGLPKFKYQKEHLFPSYEKGKSKRAYHPSKPVPNSKQRLHLLHMDLCGPIRVESINGKRYVLVIVDDYSCYTWVHFVRSKDEAPEAIKTFLKKIQVLLQALVIIVRTDNDTEFKNQVLQEYFNNVGISLQASSV
ncbi:retrovirus-related pol polyprotein from transposon TNT 1-94 [Tanacetum coccineum]|uniref:Retrovirus-related pol polyprotein from transposon TNT 1-94 n=1 Tax=Tanacetum coccineum TaxID=301880 RepID=A0ABQ5AKN0_9ASTR